MTMSRRKAISLIGGGTVFAASAAMGTFLGTRMPHAALAPWNMAGGYGDPRLNALSFGLLAPNPHNLQPWKVQLEGEDGFLLIQDMTRTLPKTDPFGRQITIGLGCFLEQTRIAASTEGYEITYDLFPTDVENAVARARLRKTASPDPLAAHIMDRRSCKEPFSERAISQDHIKTLTQLGDVHVDPILVKQVKDITWKAWLTEANTPATLQESVDWMRFGKAEINASPDGIDLGGAFLETGMLLGLVSREVQSDVTSTGFQEGVKIYNKMLHATPAYFALVSDGNSRSDQIDMGARWLRTNLTTTALGLSLHPVSQALQEFEEMTPHYTAIHDLLAQDGQTVQMLGRLGYGPAVGPAPRWSLENKLLNA